MARRKESSINMAAEFDTGAFYGNLAAWHGDGNVKEGYPASPEESVSDASMGWGVEKETIYVRRIVKDDAGNDVETFRPVTGYCANTRQDKLQDAETAGVLGVVGEDRFNLQNLDLVKFVWPWVEQGLIRIQSLVSLRDGKRVCLTAEILGTDTDILPNERINRYLNLAHGHDASLAIRFGFSDINVVCSNTMTACLQTGDLLKHRHTKRALINLEAAKELFDVQRAQLRVQADIFQAMTRVTLSDDQATAYFREILHEGAGTNKEIKVRHVDRLLELYETGRGAHFRRGTLWGAFNAFTEFATHERGRKDTTNAHRFETNLFGDGNRLLGRSLELAQTLLNK